MAATSPTITFPTITFPTITSPSITLPTALAAVGQPHSLSSVQPLPPCPDGGINGTISSGLAAIIRLDSTPPITITIVIPSIISPRDVRRLFRWAGCWSGCARSGVLIAYVLTLTAVANVADIPVIHV
eukprot:CAMPEP_0113389014 /NCGR_PEP_ID=MMETSP0013_2-20120614/9394_1 /TAXON_ID=2843 ORGANISM="Skeletonema costatum, Strain 1716" /NCGR_SAMPLE_ID=MMETSP0013_2 /ASSEMBLY_ACC=CAM_ASM_000158 /LENGTH=127 /DNA_ID=CAMNT_0000272049 /DNA_START=584 /DNA_END=967 /DNA_ORIENTATION=+ /assembly_acc=CAM_ASM_000158